MKADDFRAFVETAMEKKCWIGLRKPNQYAERWIGHPDGTPKPLTCKMKTADMSGHPLAGLVVDPVLRPDAFSQKSRVPTIKSEKYKTDTFHSSRGYTVEDNPSNTKWHGVVRLFGHFLYSDYDLMFIHPVDLDFDRSMNVQKGAQEIYKTKHQFDQSVISSLNAKLKVPMIQHGPEFDAGFDGIGVSRSEPVYVFSPDGGFQVNYSGLDRVVEEKLNTGSVPAPRHMLQGTVQGKTMH